MEVDRSRLNEPGYLESLVEADTKVEVSAKDYHDEQSEGTDLFLYMKYALPEIYGAFIGKPVQKEMKRARPSWFDKKKLNDLIEVFDVKISSACRLQLLEFERDVLTMPAYLEHLERRSNLIKDEQN